jgi:probable HAF family extracellular repeat protein
MRKTLIAALSSMCTMVLLCSSAGAQVRYSLTDLGTLGGNQSEALGLNSLGDVVGFSTLPGEQITHAFLWTSSGGMQDLGSLDGGTPAYATSVNSSQEVAGYSWRSSGPIHAFYWSQATGILDLGSLSTNGDSWAFGINSSGQVAGYSYASDGHAHSFIWTQSSGLQDIGIPANETDSYGQNIDDLGRVVGAGGNGNTAEAFVWTKTGGYQLLGKLVGGVSSYGYSIDDKGAVTGFADVGNTQYPHAFLWTKRSGIQDLGTLTGGSTDSSIGVGIGLSGEIVGYDSSPEAAAIVYSKAGGLQNLNTLVNGQGVLLTGATSVNAAGQIAAEGNNSGKLHAYLLTPQ